MTTLTPAYGRDYKSKKEVEADWLAGKDFVVADVMSPHCGRYCSYRDFSGQTVNIRFKQLRNVAVIKTPAG